MKVLAINGGPRKKGNSAVMLAQVLQGAEDAGLETETVIVKDIDIKSCRGCLRCNLVKRCAIRGDDWKNLSMKIMNSDVLVFSSPVYFHHVTGELKRVLDRFRSFVNVQVTEDGLKHVPWLKWHKRFILLMAQGSSNPMDADPAIDLFNFVTRILGPKNGLTCLLGTRLIVTDQLRMDLSALSDLYQKLDLPLRLVKKDYRSNQVLLKKCYDLGRSLGSFETNP